MQWGCLASSSLGRYASPQRRKREGTQQAPQLNPRVAVVVLRRIPELPVMGALFYSIVHAARTADEPCADCQFAWHRVRLATAVLSSDKSNGGLWHGTVLPRGSALVVRAGHTSQKYALVHLTNICTAVSTCIAVIAIMRGSDSVYRGNIAELISSSSVALTNCARRYRRGHEELWSTAARLAGAPTNRRRAPSSSTLTRSPRPHPPAKFC